MHKLPARQQDLMDFILRFARDSGLPPTRGDIAAALGITRQTADQHLRALATKGLIELLPDTSRGIRILDADALAANDPWRLPLVGRIAAGAPVLAPDHVEEQLRVDPALFQPRADFLYRVQGRSMERAHILPGDLVGIHQQATARNNQIVAVAIEDRLTGEPTLTLKRYRQQDRMVTLLSENDDQQTYAPIVIDLGRQRCEIVGLFAGLIRLNRDTPES
jgi:repressor LexA